MPTKDLTSPCGLDCFNCTFQEQNITPEFIDLAHTKFKIPKEAIPCKGCRLQTEPKFHLPNGCPTLDCINEKGVEFCYECADFPCAMLAPVADEAGKYPHNYKLYNLCRMQKIGMEKWFEEASMIRNKYFAKSFIVGKGLAD